MYDSFLYYKMTCVLQLNTRDSCGSNKLTSIENSLNNNSASSMITKDAENINWDWGKDHNADHWSCSILRDLTRSWRDAVASVSFMV